MAPGRSAVRLAAIALVRALMREAGLSVNDVVRQRARTATRPRDKAKTARLVPPPSLAAPAPARPIPMEAPSAKPLETALLRAGLVRPTPGVPGVVAKMAKLEGPVIVPEGVNVTVCPSGRDTRYSADPGHVGELSRDWLARRGGHR